MKEQGYVVRENIFSYDECDRLISFISSIHENKSRAGLRHLMKYQEIVKLANEPRLIEIAQEFIGEKPIPYRATLFEKSGKANWLIMWHQDTALPLESKFISTQWTSWSIKEGINYAHAPTWALDQIIALRIHLDASTIENGPLQIIPGSYKYGVLNDEEVFEIAKTQDKVTCTVPRGGILAMKPLLIHSSSKVTQNKSRRVIHIEYCDDLQLSPNIKLAIS